MLRMDLKIEGEKNLSRAWDKLTQYYASDLRPFFRVILGVWYRSRKEAFETEGASLGKKWPALGTLANGGPPGRYGKWKQENHPSKPLLELHGDLKAAVTDERSSGAWQVVQPKFMEAGVADVPYWRVHRYGWSERHIPQRSFATLTDEHVRDIDKGIQDKMNEYDKRLQKKFGGLGTERGTARGLAR
jgi:phage gpG-like protein